MNPARPPRLGARMVLRLLAVGLGVALLTGGAVAGAFEWVGTKAVKDLPRFPVAQAPVLDAPKPGKAQTILLTGLDHRYADAKGEKSRSDTMMLLRLDPEAKATTVLSLPRDLRVVIPGHGTTPQKLNGAWAFGGAKLLTRTIRTTLLGSAADPFRINEVVSVRFDAFAQAVNQLGCLYADIDRKYFVPPGAGYAQIDQASGYQLLCGQAALAYVRFRHQDSDITREARQANFITETRTQVDAKEALTGGLVGAVKKYVQTNVHSGRQLLGIARLAVNVTGKPTKHVTLGTTFATDGSGDVLTTPADLAEAREEFLHPRAVRARKPQVRKATKQASSGAKRSRAGTARKTTATPLPKTMTRDGSGATLAAATVRPGSGSVPIYLPAARPSRGGWMPTMSHGYAILDHARRPAWKAYRVVGETGLNGQYYGVEGTSWRSPPILDLADGTLRLAGRTWKVQYDGRRVRRLSWSSPNGTYWISNTLTNDLTPAEMYALARSFRRVASAAGG
jgi:LCP family protein required for cell wall assembly